MCGIVGYAGNEDSTAVLMDGLRRLEYRGYDSAGLAVFESTKSGKKGGEDNEGAVSRVVRATGKLRCLEKELRAQPMAGRMDIGHTR